MKAREFWLTELKDYDQWSAHDSEQYDDDIHVIEKWEYDALVHAYRQTTIERDKALDLLDAIASGNKVHLETLKQTIAELKGNDAASN